MIKLATYNGIPVGDDYQKIILGLTEKFVDNQNWLRDVTAYEKKRKSERMVAKINRNNNLSNRMISRTICMVITL
jgi:hypothetical protein